MAPPAETGENKENGSAAATNEIKPDPDYEWRRQALDLEQDWKSHDQETDQEYREQTLLPRVRDLVRHNLNCHAEVEACDILMEVERVGMLLELADEMEHMDYERICLYLIRFCTSWPFKRPDFVH
jgi:hypothetical protein